MWINYDGRKFLTFWNILVQNINHNFQEPTQEAITRKCTIHSLKNETCIKLTHCSTVVLVNKAVFLKLFTCAFLYEILNQDHWLNNLELTLSEDVWKEKKIDTISLRATKRSSVQFISWDTCMTLILVLNGLT